MNFYHENAQRLIAEAQKEVGDENVAKMAQGLMCGALGVLADFASAALNVSPARYDGQNKL